jgi:hypothetical protein
VTPSGRVMTPCGRILASMTTGSDGSAQDHLAQFNDDVRKLASVTAVTAPTPEQLRVLSNEAHEAMTSMIMQVENEWGCGAGMDTLRDKGDVDVLLSDRVAAALRDAADQLEAVQKLPRHHVDAWGEYAVSARDLDAILIADTAPPEADREWPPADDGSDLTWRERNND